jgi:hypothetical protein
MTFTHPSADYKRKKNQSNHMDYLQSLGITNSIEAFTNMYS